MRVSIVATGIEANMQTRERPTFLQAPITRRSTIISAPTAMPAAPAALASEAATAEAPADSDPSAEATAITAPAEASTAPARPAETADTAESDQLAAGDDAAIMFDQHQFAKIFDILTDKGNRTGRRYHHRCAGC